MATTTQPTVDNATIRTPVDKIAKGHYIAAVEYVKVDNKVSHPRGETELEVTNVNDSTHKYNIQGNSLIEHYVSADYFDKTEKLPLTQIADKLINAGYLPFTCEFIKADGTARTLRGRFLSSETLLGRSYVHDFEAADGRPRLIDHRTLKSLIIGGVKYVLKS